MPKMTHPASKHDISVAPQYVAMYESQGWEIKAAPKAPEKSDDK